MMFIPKTLFALAASVSLLSCNLLDRDVTAARLLMGRDASELYAAYGEPKEVKGNIKSYVATWSGWVSTSPRFPSDDVSFDVPGEYFIKAQALYGRIAAIHYDSNMEVVSLNWRDKNALLIDLSDACATNDIEEVQELLAEHPSLTQASIITQAAAQAIRYKSVEVSRYLINTYKVDIHKSFETSRMTGDDFVFNMILEKTTLSHLMRENGIAL